MPAHGGQRAKYPRRYRFIYAADYNGSKTREAHSERGGPPGRPMGGGARAVLARPARFFCTRKIQRQSLWRELYRRCGKSAAERNSSAGRPFGGGRLLESGRRARNCWTERRGKTCGGRRTGSREGQEIAHYLLFVFLVRGGWRVSEPRAGRTRA